MMHMYLVLSLRIRNREQRQLCLGVLLIRKEYCERGSAVAGRVKVPLNFELGSSYPNLGVISQGLALKPEGGASVVKRSPKGLRRSTRP